jgi:hypothetical protein
LGQSIAIAAEFTAPPSLKEKKAAGLLCVGEETVDGP